METMNSVDYLLLKKRNKFVVLYKLKVYVSLINYTFYNLCIVEEN